MGHPRPGLQAQATSSVAEPTSPANALAILGFALVGIWAMIWATLEVNQRVARHDLGRRGAVVRELATRELATRLERVRVVTREPLAPAPVVGAIPIQPLVVGAELGRRAPAPRLLASAAEGVRIPRIDVDAQIIDVFLSGGEWPVPKFAVGHMGETANPGDIGNAVFAGHVQSIASGNVFARLGELEVGDEVRFLSADGERAFRVIETRLVANTDVSVIEPWPGLATVTLITCAGRWDPRQNDYDQRRIVVAEAVAF